MEILIFFSSRPLNLRTVPKLLFEFNYRKNEVFPQHFNCFEMHLSNFSPQPVWYIHSYTDWAHIHYILYISINAHNGEDYVCGGYGAGLCVDQKQRYKSGFRLALPMCTKTPHAPSLGQPGSYQHTKPAVE